MTYLHLEKGGGQYNQEGHERDVGMKKIKSANNLYKNCVRGTKNAPRWGLRINATCNPKDIDISAFKVVCTNRLISTDDMQLLKYYRNCSEAPILLQLSN